MFAGDNFFRYSGEAPEVQKLQLFAWQAAARGNDVHLNANPTQGELLHQEFKEKKEQLKDTVKGSILAKYGGEEYLEKAPKELLQGQTEEYVEYSRTGQVVKGKERVKAKSKYMEDGVHHFNIMHVVLELLTTPYSTCQQPHMRLGLMVRRVERDMGLRLLSLHPPHLLLFRPSRHRSS